MGCVNGRLSFVGKHKRIALGSRLPSIEHAVKRKSETYYDIIHVHNRGVVAMEVLSRYATSTNGPIIFQQLTVAIELLLRMPGGTSLL